MSQKIKIKISVRATESKSKIEIEKRPGKLKSKIDEPENSKRKSGQSIDNGFGLCYNLCNKH